MTFESHSYKTCLGNIGQFIKMTLTDMPNNLSMKWLVQHIDLNIKMFFFEKDLDRKHFFEKYRHVELSAIKKDLGKNNQLM